MEKFVARQKIIVCVGSGGVGKTTVSASLACLAAAQKIKTLVLTIDPAKRLADAVGLTKGSIHPRPVPGKYEEYLHMAMIDSKLVFENFIREFAPDSKIAENLINNVLFKQLSTSLNGSQEFTSIEYLLQVVENYDYDLIVLDTPPSQHAIDFLQAPEKIYNLFQRSITKWFVETDKDGLWKKIIHKGTHSVLSILGVITGAQFMKELSNFFQMMANLQDVVSRRSLKVQKILLDQKTSFALVTSFDEIKLKEAEELYDNLHRMGYHMSSIVINRFRPEWIRYFDSVSDVDFDGYPEFQSGINKFKEYYKQNNTYFEEFESKFPKEVSIVKVPEFEQMEDELLGLEKIANCLSQGGVN